MTRLCGLCHMPLDPDSHPSRKNHAACAYEMKRQQVRKSHRRKKQEARKVRPPRVLRLGADYIRMKLAGMIIIPEPGSQLRLGVSMETGDKRVGRNDV